MELGQQRINLLANVPSHLPTELTEVLLQSPNIDIERIVSLGHASPEGFLHAVALPV